MKKASIFFVLFAIIFGYFSRTYADSVRPGINIKDSSGTIYSVAADGSSLHPYTSAGAFLSYGFNSFGAVRTMNSAESALPKGNFMPPREGKLICSDHGADKGTCYLITNAHKAGFVSAQVFNDLGFDFDNALTGDLSWLPSTANISDANAAHLPGVLVNKGGTIFLAGDSGLIGIPSLAVFNSWGLSLNDVVKANDSDIERPTVAILSQRQEGQFMFASAPVPVAQSTNVVQTTAQSVDPGWQFTVYFTPVEAYYSGAATSVYGCFSSGDSFCDNYLGDFPDDFLNEIKIEGSGKLTSGVHPGKYLGYDPNKGFWLENAPLAADGNPVTPYVTAAGDPTVAFGTQFTIVNCGIDEGSNSALDASVCNKLKSTQWRVDDRFSLGTVGKHFDLYIGEQTSANFKSWSNPLMISTSNGAVQFSN